MVWGLSFSTRFRICAESAFLIKSKGRTCREDESLLMSSSARLAPSAFSSTVLAYPIPPSDMYSCARQIS